MISEVEGGKPFNIRSPEDAVQVAAGFIGEDDREVFFVMCLNTKNRVVAVHRCHVGSINASIVHPMEVFKSAILNNSAAIILCHQHPFQDTDPSREDIEVTKRLVESGRMMGIEVLDHLVVNANTLIHRQTHPRTICEPVVGPKRETNALYPVGKQEKEKTTRKSYSNLDEIVKCTYEIHRPEQGKKGGTLVLQ